METSPEKFLVLGWWNTSLSPLGKPRENARSEQIAQSVVNSLVDEDGVDFLALGEVSSSDLEMFSRSCGDGLFKIFDGTSREGRLRYDMGIIYNPSKFQVLGSRKVMRVFGKTKLKIAHRIDFAMVDTDDPLHIFITHWSSRLFVGQYETKRDALGMMLRSAVDEIFELNLHPQIILIGDFNDEPFDRSLSGYLFASRDRKLVSENVSYFYNPFWRLLGESLPYRGIEEKESFAGTYFHGSGNETRWRTLDQIIVSSSFLSDKRWHLNEELVSIWRRPPLNELIHKSNEVFDHFPVISVIQKKPEYNEKV